MALPDPLRPEANIPPAWTILVDNAAFEELSATANQQGVPLSQYVADFISIRAAVELIAPSPTWLAIPTEVSAVRLTPSHELAEQISALCQLTGHNHDVVISNLASGGPPVPPAELPLGYLRTDPGRGRIFGMYFEIAGFQYSLMRHLAGDTFRIRQVLDAAFLALASQATITGKFLNEPIGDAARQFATKVVMIANRRRVEAREGPMTHRRKTTAGASRGTPTDQVSAGKKTDPESAERPSGEDPIAAYGEWSEDIDTKACGRL